MKATCYIKSVEEQNEELQKKLSTLEGQVDGYLKDIEKLVKQLRVAVNYGEQLNKEFQEVCKLVAEMHAAAVGEVRGPGLGPVEDIADLRKRYLELLGKQKPKKLKKT